MNTAKLEWMYCGTNNGHMAIMENGPKDPNAIPRVLCGLNTGETALPENSTLTIWCVCGKYFLFEGFDPSFKAPRSNGVIFSLPFAARCAQDGIVQFRWQCRVEESDRCEKGAHLITCLVFKKP